MLLPILYVLNVKYTYFTVMVLLQGYLFSALRSCARTTSGTWDGVVNGVLPIVREYARTKGLKNSKLFWGTPSAMVYACPACANIKLLIRFSSLIKYDVWDKHRAKVHNKRLCYFSAKCNKYIYGTPTVTMYRAVNLQLVKKINIPN